MNSYQIPGFANYRVEIEIGTENISVINLKVNRPVKVPENREIQLLGDNGKRYFINPARLVAMAFHGRPQSGEVAYYSGGGYQPHTVRFVKRARLNQLRLSKLTDKQRDEIRLYILATKMTYQQIADKYGCSHTTIAGLAKKVLKY